SMCAPTSSGTGPCGHTSWTGTSSSVPAVFETLNPSGNAVTDQDLGVSLCYTDTLSTGSCQMLWASAAGQTAAADLATHGPDIDVVVILANTKLTLGGTVQAALSASQSLVVIGVPDDDTVASNLLGHELAHTLGMADEYTGVTGTPAASVSSFPNVWQPSD